MGTSIRQRWDSVNDRPSTQKKPSAEIHADLRRALGQEIPNYRAKFVTLPNGQAEISVTPANRDHVIDARMGFNPLLDCPRKPRSAVDQEERDVENRQRAAKRAKQNVRLLTKSLFADHMLTFSYRANVIDREQVAKDWKEFVRLFRVRHPNWKYLAVLEKQERGSYHIHVAVHAKQDIRWLLNCWLIAIGQPISEVNDWLLHGLKLGAKSKGAVNVEPPKKRWGGTTKRWNKNKLAGYLTKYIGKEFEEASKYAKKYWHSRNFEKPVITRFWLRADTYLQAIEEAHDMILYHGCSSMSMWNDYRAGVVWITGETSREELGLRTSHCPELDFFND